MKRLNFKLHSYFIDENGIDNLFKIVGQAVASAGLYKLVPYLSKSNMPAAIITAMLSLVFLILSFYNGVHKFWIPLVKKIYGDREQISKFEAIGGVRNFFKPDVIIAFLGSVAVYYIATVWFDAIYEISLK